MTSPTEHNPSHGAQRLSLEKLRAWESLAYGMFIHFGMSTFDGNELSYGKEPASLYAPEALDVDQWISVARDAGMKYAILTAKHVAGHALWPSKFGDYSVATGVNSTDVVEQFVTACRKHGVLPGLYYCSWDNHNLYGSVTPSYGQGDRAFSTSEYRDFQFAQIEELLTQYGPIAEMWIDIPGMLGHDGRRKQYDQITRLQPDCIVMMNHSFGDGSKLNYNAVWPTDLMAIVRFLPNSAKGYERWHNFSQGGRLTVGAASKTEYKADAPQDYYLPAEVCDPIGYEWFYRDEDMPRSDAELLGMQLICQARHANLVLNVPPSRRGVMEKRYVDSLMRLAKNMERFGA